MKILRTVTELRAWRAAQSSLGMVPTMGALHNGHIGLLRASLAGNRSTLLSVFVNPSQFAPHEDLQKYPRTLDDDVAKFRAAVLTAQVDAAGQNAIDSGRVAVFCPSVEEMYPSGIDLRVAHQRGTFVEVLGVGGMLEGRVRPQFFRGVATVVTKLLNAAQPSTAYFGQKDVQQTVVVKQLVRDLLMPVNIEICPTAREENGLALSSRNVYLSNDEKNRMAVLYRALTAARARALSAPSAAPTTAAEVAELVSKELNTESDLIDEIEYVSVNSMEDFAVLDTAAPGCVISLAVRLLNGVRLIDNIIV